MLSERIMQRIVMQTRYNRGYVLPNLTPPGWWECDVFEITKAGYFLEYEVKRTVEDFRADARKARHGYVMGKGWIKTGTKHERLEAGDWTGPARFFFVTPASLLPLEDIPSWAGLVEIGVGHRFLRARVVKKAPQLHREKFPERKFEKIKAVPYWRMHHLLKTNVYAEADEE